MPQDENGEGKARIFPNPRMFSPAISQMIPRTKAITMCGEPEIAGKNEEALSTALTAEYRR